MSYQYPPTMAPNTTYTAFLSSTPPSPLSPHHSLPHPPSPLPLHPPLLPPTLSSRHLHHPTTLLTPTTQKAPQWAPRPLAPPLGLHCAPNSLLLLTSTPPAPSGAPSRPRRAKC